MKLALKDFSSHYVHPLTLVEDILKERGWPYEQIDAEGILCEIEGRWCAYRLYFIWREEEECFMTSCILDARVLDDQRQDTQQLISNFNPKMWMGHFELPQEEEYVSYRYTLPLRGSMGLAPEQLEDLLESTISECDRFYPALQFILWGGKSPEEAAFSAMIDIAGEA